MSDALQTWTVRLHCRLSPALGRARDERGEGVISAAIAVLIMAFLGVAAWVAFDAIFQDAANQTQQQVNQIGG